MAHADFSGQTVGEVLAAAESFYGTEFADVVCISRVWVNGESATEDRPVTDGDEVAVVPPVSGG